MNTESPRDSAVNRDHLNRFRTKPASLRELIWSFLSTTPDLMQELERCCQRRDQENAKNLLHTLTGAALSTGATSLAERCRHLACDWERSSSPTALSLQTLQAEVENTQNALRHFMDELAEGETSLVPAARPITLLLVEDNASARALVRLVLENDRFAILEATNGREALALAERESPDLAIVDLNLGPPGPESPSGFNLLQRLRERMPAIVLTVDQRPESIRRAAAAGAWGYLLKSSDLHNLSATVEIVLARSRDLRGKKPETEALDLATGWLMATYRLDQPAARRALVHLANEKRCTTSEIAQEILESHQLHSALGRFIAERVHASAREEG
ncbi:MAG: response regulator [Candidatus Competibacteraceae bacterium]|nr:response regulator [Candidatus Competibacteraceae bacterium]